MEVDRGKWSGCVCVLHEVVTAKDVYRMLER